MKYANIISIVLLFYLSFANTSSVFSEEPNQEKLIEIEGDEGKILVFPSIIAGPQKPIIKFVMFGVYEIPEVVIDTPSESFFADVTTVTFLEGNRFSGFIEVPDEEIVRLWINDNFVSWEEDKIE